MVPGTRQDDEGGLSIWLFVGAFVLLAMVGLVVVLMVGSPTTDTRPGLTASSTTTTEAPVSSTTTTTAGPTVTLPGGIPAPDGARTVTFDDGVLRINFDIDRTELGSRPLAMVPPMQPRSIDGGNAVEVTVGCSRSTREQMSEITVAETADSVMIAAVVLVPASATVCNPNYQPTTITLPLSEPLGQRTLSVLPPSTKLPPVNLD